MRPYKVFSMPVPAQAERKRNEFMMDAKRFVEFAKALRLECDQGFLETYERKKLLFPHARFAWPRRLEERVHRHLLSRDMRPFSILTRSREFKPYIEFADIQREIDSGFGFSSSSRRSSVINTVIKEGHPISHALRDEHAPGAGVVQSPHERPFRTWNTWCFDYPEGPRLNRAEHYYGWWQVLDLYELEYINLQIENPAWRIQQTVEGKRFLKGMRWSIWHRDITPPTSVNFAPSRESVDQIWRGAWSCWSPLIERAADFDWRSYASRQCYIWQVRDEGNQEDEWDLHLQREIQAAKILTEETCNEEWIRLLRSLCRFEEHLAKEERLLLRQVVHNIIHMVSNLLQVAFKKDIRQLAMEHGGLARQGGHGLCDVDGEAVRPWHLLEILNERFLMTDRFVRPFVESCFEQFQSRLVCKLHSDCANSLLDTLSKCDNEPLLLALVSYQKIEHLEIGYPWENQQRWAAIRALIVATESETRRWFGKESLFHVFLELFPKDKSSKGWQCRWDKFNDKNLSAGNVDTTKEFINLLEVVRSNVHKRGDVRIQRLDYHIIVAYFSRNWNAHNGQNPHPNAEDFGRLVVISVMRSLFIAWDAAYFNPWYKENLVSSYSGTSECL